MSNLILHHTWAKIWNREKSKRIRCTRRATSHQNNNYSIEITCDAVSRSSHSKKANLYFFFPGSNCAGDIRFSDDGRFPIDDIQLFPPFLRNFWLSLPRPRIISFRRCDPWKSNTLAPVAATARPTRQLRVRSTQLWKSLRRVGSSPSRQLMLFPDQSASCRQTLFKVNREISLFRAASTL